MTQIGKDMSFGEIAAAIGLLTPLVLGILAFIEKFVNRKKADPTKDQPEVVQGMTVTTDSYADQLIRELKKERDEAEADNKVLRAQLQILNQRERNN